MRSWVLPIVTAILAVATACKQRDKTTPHPASTAELSSSAIGEEVGFGREFVRVGTTGPYDGTLAAIATEAYRGMSAYFAEVNARGGVHGRKIDLIARNDAYEAARAAQNVRTLLTEDKVFCLIGGFGTESLAAATDVLLEHKRTDVFGFGTYNGADVTRTGAGFDAWFNVSASFRQEAEAIATMLKTAGFSRVAVLRQDDSSGEIALQTMRDALTAQNITLSVDAKHPRAPDVTRSLEAQVTAIKNSGAEAVVAFTIYQPAAALVRDARADGFAGPIIVSSTAGDAFVPFLASMAREGKKTRTGIPLAPFDRPLVSTSLVPNWEDESIPLVAEFRALLERRSPDIAPGVRDAMPRATPYHAASLHGFYTAKLFVEALERTGPNLTRAAFRNAVERMSDFDPGIGGSHVSFGPKRHQAIDRVFTLGVRDGRWITLADPTTFLRGRSGGEDTRDGALRRRGPKARPAGSSLATN